MSSNSNIIEYNRRIGPKTNGLYRYNRIVHKNRELDFEIVVDGIDIHRQYNITNTSPITLFIDEGFVIRDFNFGYYVSTDNYEKLIEKLKSIME